MTGRHGAEWVPDMAAGGYAGRHRAPDLMKADYTDKAALYPIEPDDPPRCPSCGHLLGWCPEPGCLCCTDEGTRDD